MRKLVYAMCKQKKAQISLFTQRGDSNEYPQHMFYGEISKNSP